MNIIKCFLVLIFLFTQLHALDVVVDDRNNISILDKSKIFVDDQSLPLQEIIGQNLFQENNQSYLNFGVINKTVWVKFSLQNNLDTPVKKALVINSPLLEYIALYDKNNLESPSMRGRHYLDANHTTLSPMFELQLPAHSSSHYFLEVKSVTASVKFGIFLYEKDHYIKYDMEQQLLALWLMGVVAALLIYSFLIFIYTQDKSYLYYSFMLFTILYHQFTYLGLSQIYFSQALMKIENLLVIAKINLSIIASAFFSISFLQIKKSPSLYISYKIFIMIAIIESIILSIPGLRNMYIVMITSGIYITYNLLVGFISYIKGNKQARLFILGHSVVYASYIIMILDLNGLTMIVHKWPNFMMFAIAFEAMILSLAFVDRYNILQKQKEATDLRLIHEAAEREKMIQFEVDKKTDQLQEAMQSQQILFLELHHRVKNNLQLILSLTRLQKDEIKDQEIKQKFSEWENRIRAISKTHEILYLRNDIEMIDMSLYIKELTQSLQESFLKENVTFVYDIDLKLPLKEAVYIGLIVNELISNALEHAFDQKSGEVSIILNRSSLQVLDNGKGFDYYGEERENLGLQLVSILTKEQLKAALVVENKNGMHYTITF